MNKTGRQKNGFTIVELMMYSAILVSFLYIMTQVFGSILDVQLTSEAASAVAQDGRYLLSRFSYDMERASAIATPSASGTTTPSLWLTINGVSNEYTVQNGNIVLVNDFGTEQLNSFGTTVSSVSFSRFGSANVKNNIQFKFTISSKTVRNTGSEVQSFQTTVGLR